MALTYVPLSTTTVGASGTASIDFTSIPQTYTDLAINLSARTNENATKSNVLISFNGTTSNPNYEGMYLQGGGTGGGVGSSTFRRYLGDVPGTTATSSTFGSIFTYISNYTEAINKPFYCESVAENNNAQANSFLIRGVWVNTSALSSISITPLNGVFVQYSTATLYGIKKA